MRGEADNMPPISIKRNPKQPSKPRPSFIKRIKAAIERAGLWIDSYISGPSLSIIPAGPDVPGMGQGGLILGRANAAEAFEFRNQSGDRRITIRSERSPEVRLKPREPHAATSAVSDMIRRQQEITSGRKVSSEASIRAIAGRRISMENPSVMGSGLEAFTQFNRNSYWHQTTISSRFNTDNFAKIEISELAELLTELSPEVSAALWYYLLCCNSGYEIDVFKPGTDDPYEEAKNYLDGCLATLGAYHGTLNTYFDKTFMSIFMRGSFLYELVLDENAKDFVDIAAPDPKTLHFRRKVHPMRGQIWDFGQYQNGDWVSLDIPTVRYVPLHPLPGRIEGRPMINPVFFTSIFLMSVLRDLKRVIQQQGYMRLDLEVVFEKLKDAMPRDAQNDPAAFKGWADSVVDEISSYYSQLEPDDAFVHGDAVQVNSPVGTANANSLSAMEALFKFLERMAVRALKTLPGLLGLEESSNQASENRKFEFYQKGNETIQRMVETAFDGQCKLILQAAGYQADVRTQFAQMRASEELRDLQIETLKSKLSRYQYDCGWINQDEAAKMATGKDMADQPEPRNSGEELNVGGIAQLQPDPGANRFVDMSRMLRNPTMADLQNAYNIWQENAPEIAKDLIDAIPAE